MFTIIKINKCGGFNICMFVSRLKKKEISYVVEEADPGRNGDLLLDPEGVPGIRIEVY